jgi:alpha-tubulin suppressor-like RCC1 family protein
MALTISGFTITGNLNAVHITPPPPPPPPVYLWSWGQGSSGQHGLGNTTSVSSPTQIGALSTWTTIDAGWRHGMAVKTDGTLWTWGENYGRLGLGNTAHRSSPVQVGASLWSMIGTKYYGFQGTLTTGVLYAWGDNSEYAIGNNSLVATYSTVEVPTTLAATTIPLYLSSLNYGMNLLYSHSINSGHHSQA